MAISSPSGYSAAPAETSKSVVLSPPLGGTVSLKEEGGLNSTTILFNLNVEPLAANISSTNPVEFSVDIA